MDHAVLDQQPQGLDGGIAVQHKGPAPALAVETQLLARIGATS